MNLALWLLVGGFAGWFGYSVLNANPVRGLFTSILIGMGGGFLGGSLVAPLIEDAATVATTADAFNLIALIMAAAFAAVCLTVSDMVYRRFNV